MKIAVEGCAHGELEKIYDVVAELEQQQKIKVDLLICCGDFQSVRNIDDLDCMAVPKKYQEIGTFYKYYSGEKVAPIPTIFIGGNHEASNYLQELPYGGWVAPNIYYLGYAGVVQFNGVRIAGISGIFNEKQFFVGHYESPPYSENTLRTVYHQRQLESFRLAQLTPGSVDVFLSHDWPRGVTDFGNFQQLLRFKPHFRNDIERGQLGSTPCKDLLHKLQPRYWFSAHLHCKFSALVPHEESGRETKFLALDKCLPRRRFLQILDIEEPENAPKGLHYDLEWLTILSLTNHLLNVRPSRSFMPGPGGNVDERHDFCPSEEEKSAIKAKFSDLKVPENFAKVSPAYDPSQSRHHGSQPEAQVNMQTTQFCERLGVDDPLSLVLLLAGKELNYSVASNATFNDSCDSTVAPLASSLPQPMWIDDRSEKNDEQIDIGESEEETEEQLAAAFTAKYSTPFKASGADTSRTKLVLPSPKFEGAGETPQKVALSSTLDESESPALKKFKRRNQEIYAEAENEG